MPLSDEIHDLPLRWFGLRSIPGIPIELDDLTERSERRNGPRKLDSALSEIFLGFQAAKLAWTGS
jgi:hypothetical protein